VLIVRQDGGNARVAAPLACPSCGHDLVTMLQQVVGERHDAWRTGVLEGYGDGWRDGLLAGGERGAA
jgi:hypothetical protein